MLTNPPDNNAFLPLFMREAAVFVIASIIIWGRTRKRSASDTTNLAQRFTTFLAIVPLANICAYFGGPTFTAMIIALEIVCIKEYMDLMSVSGALRRVSYFFAVLLSLLAGQPSTTLSLGAQTQVPYFYLVPVLVLIVVPVIPVFLQRYQNMLKAVSASLFAILYVAFLLSHLILLRAIADINGALLFILLLSSVILNDTLAFSFARLVGKYSRHQMVPLISPAKTWEGFVGGMIGSLVFFLMAREFLPQVSDLKMLGLYLAVVIFAPLGDLAISVVKRETQVKDTSTLLPGHGGFLDRFDSLILSAPVFYYIALV